MSLKVGITPIPTFCVTQGRNYPNYNILCVTFFVTNWVEWRIHRCKKCTLHVTCLGKQWKFAFERLLIFWLTKVWLRTFCVTNQVKRRILRCKKCTLHVTCQGKQWKVAFEDYSSFDSPRYDCVLFLSLIKLNGESIAAKNVIFMSLVKVYCENLPLKDY